VDREIDLCVNTTPGAHPAKRTARNGGFAHTTRLIELLHFAPDQPFSQSVDCRTTPDLL
jgi:hypothetical protein